MASLLAVSLPVSIFFFFCLFSLSSSLPSQTILQAAEILANAGLPSMAVNLELSSQIIAPKSGYLTIFCPPEAAFKQTGHIPLALLQYHMLPHAFSLQSLKSLPFGAKLSTLLPDHSLIITSSFHDTQVSINNVTVKGSPVFDDGSLIILGTNKFFDPYFWVKDKPKSQRSILGCTSTKTHEKMWFHGAYYLEEASAVLRNKGCSVMASFLDMQFLGFKDQPVLTLLAPIDEVMVNHIGNLTDYSSIMRRHLVPCRVGWSDLMNVDHGIVLTTFDSGYSIRVSRSGDMVLLNGVPIIFPDLYHNDRLVVHGLSEALPASKTTEHAVELTQQIPNAKNHVGSSIGYSNYDEEGLESHYHFSVFH